MDARSAARMAAVQALYGQELGAEAEDTDKKLKHLKTVGKGFRVNKKIYETIMESLAANRDKIDALITGNLAEGWKMERIGGVPRAILRAALAEHLATPGTPKPLIISEYVNIAADFYDEGEVKFVNAILEKVI